MGVADKLREVRWRRAGHYDRPLPDAFTAALSGRQVLEVGGPSHVFSSQGLAPVYGRAAVVDGAQFAETTVWHGEQRGAYAPEGEPTGRLHIADGTTLIGLPDGAYDGVISSHVIEHFANPLKALQAWRRVCRGGGWLLLVAPHKEGTFDHRRPVTTLAHMVEDLERGTPEEDLTHLEETLALHDRSRDAEPDDQEAWAQKRRDNVQHRVLHHHVLTTRSLVELLAHAGVEVAAVEARHPHDVYVAGRFNATGEPADVPVDLLRDALRASPFGVDRADARGL